MALCVGIAGGTGAGKSTLARALAARLGDAVVVEQDWYYRDLSALPAAVRARVNFDTPRAVELGLMARQVRGLLAGRAALAPAYDFTRHVRTGDVVEVAPAAVVIVEGLHVLGHAGLRALMALKIFVDAPDDVRFIRRLTRDTAERGRTQDSVVRQYLEQARPMHARWVAPARDYADMIVRGEGKQGGELRAMVAAVRALMRDQRPRRWE